MPVSLTWFRGLTRRLRRDGNSLGRRIAQTGTLALAALVLTAGGTADAFSADGLTGREVLQRMEAVRARGDGAAKRYEVRLINESGLETSRIISTKRKRCGDDARDLLLVHEPPDVAGTAVLTYTYRDRAPAMWLWAPELGRVRQLNPFAQSDSLFGTDITWGDLVQMPVELRKHRLVGETEVDDSAAWIVESTPLLPERYGRIVTWVSKAFSLPVRLSYYDRADALLKSGRFDDIRIRQGIPTAARVTMDNHRNRRRTVATLLDVDYDAPLSCDRLTKRHLQRAR